MDWVFSVHNLIIMEQLIISLRVPNPRTIFNKTVYWLSLCCQCQNLEISEHRRGNSRITVEWNRSRGPAAGARRRAHFRARRQPATVSVGWTNNNNTNTNIAVWIGDVWVHSSEWLLIHRIAQRLTDKASTMRRDFFPFQEKQNYVIIIHATWWKAITDLKEEILYNQGPRISAKKDSVPV